MFFSTRYSRFPVRKSMTSRKEKTYNATPSIFAAGDSTLEDLKQSLVRFQRIQSERRTPTLQKYLTPRSRNP